MMKTKNPSSANRWVLRVIFKIMESVISLMIYLRSKSLNSYKMQLIFKIQKSLEKEPILMKMVNPYNHSLRKSKFNYSRSYKNVCYSNNNNSNSYSSNNRWLTLIIICS
jgi:hypothetical protein